MQFEVQKLVYDIDQAVSRIIDFVHGKRLVDYQNDTLLRSAVERQFEIIGEALNRLKQIDSDILDRMIHHEKFCSIGDGCF